MDAFIGRLPFLLVILVRVTAVMVAVPFFNQPIFLNGVKLAFAFLLSLLLLPAVPTTGWALPVSLPGLIVLLLQELAIGLAIGLIVLIVLSAMEVLGQLMSFQMTFSMSTVLDPTLGVQSNVISVLLVMLAALLFIMLGGDHFVLQTLARSFRVLPPGQLTVTRGAVDLYSRLVTHAMTVGFQLAAPAVVLQLSVDFTLSLVSKTAAKMQIFFVGMPLKLALGLVGMGLLLGTVLKVWSREVAGLPALFSTLFRLLGAAHG
jgi:flagellar biosynthetic protein FliR